MDERQFYEESRTRKPATLNCPWCKTQASYDLNWLVRRKKKHLPHRADERAKAIFKKSQSYMLLLDDRVSCTRCRRSFDISGVKTMAYLTD